MKHTHRIFARLGFLLSAIAIFLGAFGAHFLKELISESDLNTFDTGVRYQMYHSFALMMLSMMHRKFDEKKLSLALGLFLLGIIIFSGSLYLLATRNIWGDDSFKVIGALTPLGGACFIGGWLVMFFKGFLPEDDKSSIFPTTENRRRRHKQSKDDAAAATVKE